MSWAIAVKCTSSEDCHWLKTGEVAYRRIELDQSKYRSPDSVGIDHPTCRLQRDPKNGCLFDTFEEANDIFQKHGKNTVSFDWSIVEVADDGAIFTKDWD